jgi:hypothetical protein
LSVRYRILSKPQSFGIPYCLPWYWPALTSAGFKCLRFGINFGSHGWTSPLCAKYFTQPMYGRKRSNFCPAWNFDSAFASFVMTEI